jgi:threonine/homoserine/homoserine lactone efflux protein
MFLEWDLLVFVAALSVAAFSPGPGLAATVATVLARGARVAVWFCVGVIAGDLAWLALSLSGLALIAQKIPIVFVAIKWAGIAYLIYIAAKIWRSSPDATNTISQPREKSVATRVLAGFSITMGNPKAMLFYIALLPSLVSPERISIPMVMSLFLAVIAVLTTVFVIYVFAAEKTRSVMTSNQSVQTFNRVTATALGGAAIWIGTK